jgi:DNA-binding GntR family transcriptional regulator
LPGAQVLKRQSAPELVADALRARITAGELEPGTKIVVELTAKDMGVSANTLREGLQLLEHERLVTQFLNRGIFVTQLTPEDVRDLYQMRRLLELGALRSVDQIPEETLAVMRDSITKGDRAIRNEDWAAASAATIEFHTAVVSMLGSERATETMRRLMAELSLTLASVHEKNELRAPFHNVRSEIVDLLAAGKTAAAVSLLASYLDDGEASMSALLPGD